MSSTQPLTDHQFPEADIPRLADLYKELCTNIRVSDEMSFKLLGLVPLAAGLGSGALALVEKAQLLGPYNATAVIFLSAIGALATLGIFRWELRNIQKCNWFVARAARLESHIFRSTGLQLQFDGMPSLEYLHAKKLSDVHAAPLLKFPWGKTQAERLIYLAAIGAWFVPLAIAGQKILACTS